MKNEISLNTKDLISHIVQGGPKVGIHYVKWIVSIPLYIYQVLLIPTVFTQQYFRLDVQLSKLHVSAFMAIIRLTKDCYQLRYKNL